MSETVWMMDSEFCCRCGAMLDFFESVLCFFCYEEEGREEAQHIYEGFCEEYGDEEVQV